MKVPFGYVNIAPMFTGILTVASVLLGIISVIRYNTIKKTKVPLLYAVFWRRRSLCFRCCMDMII